MQHDKGSLSNAFARSAGLLVFRNEGSPSAAAKLVEFPEKAADGSLSANRSSETFPYVPHESRVLGCEQESRLNIPWGFRDTHWLTGNEGKPRTVLPFQGRTNSLPSFREFTFSCNS